MVPGDGVVAVLPDGVDGRLAAAGYRSLPTRGRLMSCTMKHKTSIVRSVVNSILVPVHEFCDGVVLLPTVLLLLNKRV